jgi:hypothetical protein
LFRIDPGWPFVIAGLLLLVAGVLIPAQRDLHELRNSLAIHKAVEDRTVRQLAAYDRFLTDLDAAEPQLVNRLAASQLNLMPKDERSMLLVPTLNSTVTDWIEDSEPMVMPITTAYPDTLLSRLAIGPRRLWVLAAGAFLVFVGLMLSPSAPSAGRRARGPASSSPSEDPITARADSSAMAIAAPVATAVAAAVVVNETADDPAVVSAVESATFDARSDAAFAMGSGEEVESSEDEASEDEASEDDSIAASAVVGVDASLIEVKPAAEIEPGIEPGIEIAGDVETKVEVESGLEVEADAEVEFSAETEAEAEAETEADTFARADHEESSDLVEGSEDSSVIESIERADTPALASELESELEDALEQASMGDAVAYVEPKALDIEVRETPSANDRALDTWSLFDGLSHEAPSRDGEASWR